MDKYSIHPNPLVKFLQKEPKEFTKEDIINFIVARAYVTKMGDEI